MDQICNVLETRGILTLDVFESLKQRIKEEMTLTRLPQITCAASLAHHGLLGSVERMELCDVDLTSVPAEHLASLASCVMWAVTIKNVSGGDLVTILDSVKSDWLYITRQSLGIEETQALVRAMDSGVKKLNLNVGVTLDIAWAIRYNGQGKCRKVECVLDTTRRYREQLRTWATSRKWKVTLDDEHSFNSERI